MPCLTEKKVEIITRDIPNIDPNIDYSLLEKLNEWGIVKVGSWIKDSDILIGKVTQEQDIRVRGIYRLYQALTQDYEEDDEEHVLTKNSSVWVPDDLCGRVLKVEVELDGDPVRDKADCRFLDLPDVDRVIRIYVAQIRKLQEGDKLSGRHGNKGVVSFVEPFENMPYLPNGQVVDVLLCPLGVAARMNIGQVFECSVGRAADGLNWRMSVPQFDERYDSNTSSPRILHHLNMVAENLGVGFEAGEQTFGKVTVRDGRTGLHMGNPIVVGSLYVIKLMHMVDEKVHARCTGPYVAMTQQPVKGRSHGGGQRLGEMEVWAFKAYGAEYNLRELLTIKSDNLDGRAAVYETLAQQGEKSNLDYGYPEAFKLFLSELQALCLDISRYKKMS